jgi:hypothetical protein
LSVYLTARDDLIHAMSLWKPDPTIDEEAVPDSVQDAFNKRYTIITPPSLDAVKSTFPKLFPKETKVDVP